jgi:hypothetical protein
MREVCFIRTSYIELTLITISREAAPCNFCSEDYRALPGFSHFFHYSDGADQTGRLKADVYAFERFG